MVGVQKVSEEVLLITVLPCQSSVDDRINTHVTCTCIKQVLYNNRVKCRKITEEGQRRGAPGWCEVAHACLNEMYVSISPLFSTVAYEMIPEDDAVDAAPHKRIKVQSSSDMDSSNISRMSTEFTWCLSTWMKHVLYCGNLWYNHSNIIHFRVHVCIQFNSIIVISHYK